jgi:hypothetical protein
LIDLQNYCIYDARSFGFFKRLGWKALRNSIQSNLVGVGLPGINVGMKRELWGLTLWLVSYIIQMSEKNIKNSIKSTEDLALLSQISIMKQKMKSMDITFKKSYLIGIPMSNITKIWYYKNRVHQFTYIRSKWVQPQNIALLLLILCLITIIVVVHL